jgi:uncharacterized protein (TIGR02996 family)
MTDRQMLLAAILDRPEDDTPRGLFADHVEDDEPEYAEFIRVQVELARMPPMGPRQFDLRYMLPGPWDALRRRERELKLEFGREWFGDSALWVPADYPAGASPQVPGLVIRRGFPDEWRGPADWWLLVADGLLAARPTLRRVTLTDRTDEAPRGNVYIPGVGGFGNKASFEARWPGVTFTLSPPPARTHQYSHWQQAIDAAAV